MGSSALGVKMPEKRTKFEEELAELIRRHEVDLDLKTPYELLAKSLVLHIQNLKILLSTRDFYRNI